MKCKKAHKKTRRKIQDTDGKGLLDLKSRENYTKGKLFDYITQLKIKT